MTPAGQVLPLYPHPAWSPAAYQPPGYPPPAYPPPRYPPSAYPPPGYPHRIEGRTDRADEKARHHGHTIHHEVRRSPALPYKLPTAKLLLPEPKPSGGAQHGGPPPEAPPPALAAPVPPPDTAAKDQTDPAAKLPRFAALKTDETNMRKGPGQRYPIEWVYKRHDLPLEVEREYDVWRYVRDPEGVEGWVHQVTLSDRRTFMVQSKDAVLRSDATDTASAIATLQVGVIGRLRACDAGSKWCQVQVSGYKGYLRRDQFWGALPDEVIGPS